MIQCKIVIENEDGIGDSLFVLVNLPAMPRVGDLVWTGEKSQTNLEKQVTASLSTAQPYFPDWFYGASCGAKELTEANLPDLGFDDAILVKNVLLIEDSPYPLIVLGSY